MNVQKSTVRMEVLKWPKYSTPEITNQPAVSAVKVKADPLISWFL